MSPAELYVYKAHITGVVDGDTLRADIDLGFGVWKRNQKIRLLGCNCPEKHGKTLQRGLEAQYFTESLIFGDGFLRHLPELIVPVSVLIQTIVKDTDDFGRLLAKVWVKNQPKDLSAILIEAGHAVPFH